MKWRRVDEQVFIECFLAGRHGGAAAGQERMRRLGSQGRHGAVAQDEEARLQEALHGHVRQEHRLL